MSGVPQPHEQQYGQPYPSSPAAAGPSPQAWPAHGPAVPVQAAPTGPAQPPPGVYGTPTPGVYGTPSGPPAQNVSGPPSNVYGTASGPPAQNVSGPPSNVYGTASGPPAQNPYAVSAPPAQAPPAQAWPATPAQPVSPQPAAGWNRQDPPADAWQPRITPSPPRRKVLPIVIAVVVAVLVAGPAGWFVGKTMTDDKKPSTQPSPAASTALPAFEANQLAANKAKFNGDLAGFAEGWLPYVGGCLSDTDPGGDALQQGEKNRISCRSGGMGISFVLYTSTADRDAVRVAREKQNAAGGALAPGVAAPSAKTAASGKTGNYVEYAFRDGSGKTIAGIWWDRQDLPVTAYVEAVWTGDLRESWEPIRDVWQRRS